MPVNKPAVQPPLVTIRDLRVWFPIKRGIIARTVGHVKAVDGVNLDIYPGETVGLVGESGCGKTTLGRALIRLEEAQSGSVQFKDHKMLEMSEHELRPFRQELQMIFQDPFSSLNPRMTIMGIVTEGLRQHRKDDLLKEGVEAAAERLLAEVGVDARAVHRYPHEFSGGQRQRISIARAMALNPQFVICDEAVSALDVSVQAAVINLLMDLKEKHGLAYLFISHDLSVVQHISDRIAVMYLGRIVEIGKADDVIHNPQHPYTQALISAVPVPGKEKKDRIILEGDVPSPANPPSGCPFHTRCPKKMDRCSHDVPTLKDVKDRKVSCLLFD
jgi:oligopeptide/dipeptide ABC transporter ATP-binding protein